MTNTIEQKALALIQECVGSAIWKDPITRINRRHNLLHEALCRAIQQHEDFRQEVSDAVVKLGCWPDTVDLGRFIIAKPDPLVEAAKEAGEKLGTADWADFATALREAIAKRSGRILWGEG